MPRLTHPLRHRFATTLLAALLLYAVLVASQTSPVAAGSDSAGYLLSARLLTEGQLSTPLRTVPGFPPAEVWENTPLGMIFSERAGALIPTYPVGLPILYAIAGTVAGWHWGPILVATAMACGAALFTFLCVRRVGVRREIAGPVAVALAACPLVFYTTFQPLSDTASVCFNAFAVACALRAGGTRSLAWSLGAGAGLAAAVLVRPSNLLLAPALVVALGHWRPLAGAILGGLPGALGLAWYHHALYGSVTTTGYGSVWGMFGGEHILPSLRKYLIWVPAFLPVGAIGVLALPWLPWRERRREITAMLLWVLAFFLFYAFYPPTHENRWYLRFVLPAFPALLALAGLALEAVLVPLQPRPCAVVGRWAIACALAASLGTSVYHWRSARLGELAEGAAVFRDLPQWVDAHLPQDAILLTLHHSCAFYVYTDRAIVRSDVIKPARFAALAAHAREQGQGVYAVVTRADDEPSLPERLPGTWAIEKRFGDFGVWRLVAGRDAPAAVAPRVPPAGS